MGEWYVTFPHTPICFLLLMIIHIKCRITEDVYHFLTGGMALLSRTPASLTDKERRLVKRDRDVVSCRKDMRGAIVVLGYGYCESFLKIKIWKASRQTHVSAWRLANQLFVG